jgi:hypothetical protein
MIILITIATMAPSTTLHSGGREVLVIIILVNYLIPIQWSEGLDVACLVLPAAWWCNLSAEIVDTVPRGMITGAFQLLGGCCVQIEVID